MVSDRAMTFREVRYPTDHATGRIAMTADRMSSRVTRWGDEYVPHTISVITRWVDRWVRREDCVRVRPVLVRDASDEPDWFIRDTMGVRWSTDVVQGPIPGLQPGLYVPMAERTAVLAVAVLDGSEGWRMGPAITPRARTPEPPDPYVEVRREVLLMVAKRYHDEAHGPWPIAECTEPTCLEVVAVLG